jgi:hypothetical protein
MPGWVLFHRLTDVAMPGTHDQKVRVTLPLLLLPPVLLLVGVAPLLQAARARIAAAAAPAASRSLRRNLGLRPALWINDVMVLLPPKLRWPRSERRPGRITDAVPQAVAPGRVHTAWERFQFLLLWTLTA